MSLWRVRYFKTWPHPPWSSSWYTFPLLEEYVETNQIQTGALKFLVLFVPVFCKIIQTYFMQLQVYVSQLGLFFTELSVHVLQLQVNISQSKFSLINLKKKVVKKNVLGWVRGLVPYLTMNLIRSAFGLRLTISVFTILCDFKPIKCNDVKENSVFVHCFLCFAHIQCACGKKSNL